MTPASPHAGKKKHENSLALLGNFGSQRIANKSPGSLRGFLISTTLYAVYRFCLSRIFSISSMIRFIFFMVSCNGSAVVMSTPAFFSRLMG